MIPLSHSRLPERALTLQGTHNGIVIVDGRAFVQGTQTSGVTQQVDEGDVRFATADEFRPHLGHGTIQRDACLFER